ncbi:hypothetical protein CBS101457_003152 [Exobasidium rhododendri]|nr:hypothetical protein CBS101457_003152 [Exobasidium rhododendri]
MPRTRRNKVVSLTKTPKRNTRSSKEAHIQVIREAAATYPTIVVFYIANLRNTHLQEIRKLWKENSKLVFGKNKVVSKALGVDTESEVRTGLSGVSKSLEGPVGVLFTKSDPEEILEWFADYAREDFARAGNVATQDVILEAGPIMMSLDPPEPLPHSLEPQLRTLGMATELKRGVPTLLERFVVAKKGEKLTQERAQILKHLLIKDATFRLIPIVHWTEGAEETKAYPLSIEDEKIVSELKRVSATPKNAGAKAASGRKAAAAKKSKKMDDLMDADDADDSDDDFDEDEVVDAVTESMMLPAGL